MSVICVIKPSHVPHRCQLIKQIHSGKKIMSVNCVITLSDSLALLYPKRIHSGTRYYECDVCHTTFNHLSSLSWHKQIIHSGIEKYECDVCHKHHTLSSDMSQHKLIYTGIKNFECDICQNFYSVKSLGVHKQIHSRYKDECDICHKAFTLSSLLSRKQIHSGMNNYEYDVCHNTFTHASTLLCHNQFTVEL